jgi:CheY-like chemotaxis protein
MTADKKTVLIADDESRWRTYASSLLSRSGEYNIETVNDCDSALKRVEQGGIDLLVLDNLMPGEEPLDTGFDVCVHLRKQRPDLPIIFYTDAWKGVESDRAELEKKTDATVVFKVARDPKMDDLLARAKSLLA